MTKIRKSKQEKDERRTSNAQHRISNVGVAWLRLFNKIETPKAYNSSTLGVRCSMLDVRFFAAEAFRPDLTRSTKSPAPLQLRESRSVIVQ